MSPVRAFLWPLGACGLKSGHMCGLLVYPVFTFTGISVPVHPSTRFLGLIQPLLHRRCLLSSQASGPAALGPAPAPPVFLTHPMPRAHPQTTTPCFGKFPARHSLDTACVPPYTGSFISSRLTLATSTHPSGLSTNVTSCENPSPTPLN